MHPSVRHWVRCCLPEHYTDVLEIGSLDINGGVRDLLLPEALYTGIDQQEGPNVDIVDDFVAWANRRHIGSDFDVILCLEVLEHSPEWRDLLQAASLCLRAGGTLIITCATHGRLPHSGRRESPPDQDEFYENVDPEDLRMELEGLFPEPCVTVDVFGADLRAVVQTPR